MQGGAASESTWPKTGNTLQQTVDLKEGKKDEASGLTQIRLDTRDH